MHVAVVGAGAVGGRTARQLVADPAVERMTVVEPDGERAGSVAEALGADARVIPDLDELLEAGNRPAVAVVAAPPTHHGEIAGRLLAASVPVVSTSGDLDDVGALLDLDGEAVARGLAVVAGAAMSPGLSCLLAAHAATWLDEIEEVHVAYHPGGAGPACLREASRSIGGRPLDWRDGAWDRARRGGEVVWFPAPVGGVSCGGAATGSTLLLARGLPTAQRITARVAPLSRRPRRPASAADRYAAVRTEVRGWRDGAFEVHVLGAVDWSAVATAAVASITARLVGRREVGPGTFGLAQLPDVSEVLSELAARGVKAAIFDGTSAA